MLCASASRWFPITSRRAAKRLTSRIAGASYFSLGAGAEAELSRQAAAPPVNNART
jgi:hypothetical protein